MTLLEINGISKVFGGLHALRDVSFDFDGDGILGLIGPNGSGKTTMLNVITGVHRPDGGTVSVRNRTLTGMRLDEVSRIGVRRTFQESQLFAGLTVAEHIELATATARLGDPVEGSGIAIGADALELCGLSPVSDAQVDDLPFGTTRLLGVALALAGGCEVLLLDEPAAGLNQGEVEGLATIIREIAELGVGIVLVEHNMSLVFRLCHRLVVFDRGSLIARGTPDEVRVNPEVVRVYLGADFA